LTTFSGTAAQGIDMLVLKRIDVFVDASIRPDITRFKEKGMKIASLKHCLLGDVRYIGFNKKVPEEALIFAEAMKKFRQTKAYRKLLFKYSIKSNIN
jgi:hypothetical protein